MRRLRVGLCALGAALAWPAGAQGPALDLLNNTVRNLTETCQRLRYEALEVCLEYSQLGFLESDCEEWQRLAETICASTGGNCTAISEALLNHCKFQLERFVPAPFLRLQYCNQTAAAYREYRCPPASYSPLNATFCNSDEAWQCMEKCGNYRGCYCRVRRATANPDACHGDTILHGPLPGVFDSFTQALVSTGNYSCSTMGQPPVQCRHHVPEGSCGKYKHCTPDMCIIKDVTCPNRTQCEAEGICEPKEGLCQYMNKPDGSNCTDGLSYTLEDRCLEGQCLGTTDYCLKYNTSCAPESVCLSGGRCNPASGRCRFEKKPEGMACSDDREYTVEDRCINGLCLGKVVNLCVERGVACRTPNSCYDPGICDPLTGLCSDAVAASDNRRCDDLDPTTVNETCIDGICLGERVDTVYEFLTLSGRGECTDRDGRRMARYTGDVLEGEAACEEACRDDVQCGAYGYAYPLCTIYGTVRTRPPDDGRPWSFQLGSDPPAVAVEKTLPPVPGQRATVCRRRGFVPDVLAAAARHQVNAESYFGIRPVVVFCVAMLVAFLACPAARCVGLCLCPQRCGAGSDAVEAFQSPKANPEWDTWQAAGKADDLRALASAPAVGAALGEGPDRPPSPPLSTQPEPPLLPLPLPPPGQREGVGPEPGAGAAEAEAVGHEVR